jgi:small-conductance mechanosensitive channel
MKYMIREIAIFLALACIAAVSWFGYGFYPDSSLLRLCYTFGAIAAAYLAYTILSHITVRAIKDKKTRYTFNKALFVLSCVVLLVIVMRIWVEETQSLLISYGILAAGLAIALQDLVRNFVGGIYVILSGLYGVGDRVEIGGMFGDVMDVGIMNTTLLEIRGWVKGDQPTGRISIVPNSVVISGTVHNFTKDHNFIWDEISLPLTYESDWKKAIQLITSIVWDETREITEQAEAEIERIGEKYYLPKKVIEPAIFVTLTDNWINLDIRYVTDTRNRRALHDTLSRQIMDALEKEERIQIASESLIVQGTHSVQLTQPAFGGIRE